MLINQRVLFLASFPVAATTLEGLKFHDAIYSCFSFLAHHGYTLSQWEFRTSFYFFIYIRETVLVCCLELTQYITNKNKVILQSGYNIKRIKTQEKTKGYNIEQMSWNSMYEHKAGIY